MQEQVLHVLVQQRGAEARRALPSHVLQVNGGTFPIKYRCISTRYQKLQRNSERCESFHKYPVS